MILIGWVPVTGGFCAALLLVLGLCKAAGKPTPKDPQ